MANKLQFAEIIGILEDERRLLVAKMSWLRRIRGRSRREKVRNE